MDNLPHHQTELAKNGHSARQTLIKLLAAEPNAFNEAIDCLAGGHQDWQLTKLKSFVDSLQNQFRSFFKVGLGLDMTTVSPLELYNYALSLIDQQGRVVEEKYLGLNSDLATTHQVLSACIDFLGQLELPKNTFKLKDAKATQMLEECPPPAILKEFRVDSVADLLKKISLEEVYAALRFAEGDEWLDNFNKQYTKLKPKDFEEGPIRLVRMPLRWAPLTKHFINKKRHNITHSKELGLVIVLETEDPALRRGLSLKALPLIVHYFFEVQLYGNFFKLKASSGNPKKFGVVVSETILAKPAQASLDFASDRQHWSVIQRYFGKLEDAAEHREIFLPHLQPEDLHWRKAEGALAAAIPELAIWLDLDWVGDLVEGEILNLNFMDLSLSYANQEDFGARYNYHFRESLWNQICAAYQGIDFLEKSLLEDLDNGEVKVC